MLDFPFEHRLLTPGILAAGGILLGLGGLLLGAPRPGSRTHWAGFLAVALLGFAAAFDDHAKLAGLGIGAILNIPLCFGGCCIGTLNLCHQPGWFTARHEVDGLPPWPALEGSGQAAVTW